MGATLSLALVLMTAAGCAGLQTSLERQFIPTPVLANAAFAQSPSTQTASAEQVRIDHAAWDTFLGAYLIESSDGVNRVNYAGVNADAKANLDAYIDMLEAVDPAQLSRDEQLAFWINLYNAVTVAVILDAYPVESIRDIKSNPFDFSGPWDDDRVTVAGQALSLNAIEHEIIRPVFKDPRIHYAVNCASIGCPNLRPEAFRAETLDRALNEQARAYVNHPRGVSVSARGKITASKIFTWYREDFGADEAAVLDHVRQYADQELLDALDGKTSIDAYAYDWSLNETP
ncbi:MAG: DUF547 domain-containing protein [Pseudomonadota bacterium]